MKIIYTAYCEVCGDFYYTGSCYSCGSIFKTL